MQRIVLCSIVTSVLLFVASIGMAQAKLNVPTGSNATVTASVSPADSSRIWALGYAAKVCPPVPVIDSAGVSSAWAKAHSYMFLTQAQVDSTVDSALLIPPASMSLQVQTRTKGTVTFTFTRP